MPDSSTVEGVLYKRLPKPTGYRWQIATASRQDGPLQGGKTAMRAVPGHVTLTLERYDRMMWRNVASRDVDLTRGDPLETLDQAAQTCVLIERAYWAARAWVGTYEWPTSTPVDKPVDEPGSAS